MVNAASRVAIFRRLVHHGHMKKLIVTTVLALGVTLGSAATAEARSTPPVNKPVITKISPDAPNVTIQRFIDWD